VDLIVDTFMARDDATLIAVGPLTNVAVALRREPRIAGRIRRISLMGGARGLGNFSPAAEFNILADPEAARIVFESGVPITMCGLELTRQAVATADVIDRVAALGTPVGEMCTGMLKFYAEATKMRRRSFGPALHDPCSVAWLIDPSLVATEAMHVEIETNSEFSYGRTVVDVDDVMHKPANVDVAVTLDAPRFWDLLIGALAGYRGGSAGEQVR
jgi:inosine-uridine nucleoside N-ribohydrolase